MNNKLKRSISLWAGIATSVIVYFVIHEGTHLTQALLTKNFNYIRIVGLLGIEIMIKEVPTGVPLALFSGLSSIITVVCGYILAIKTPKIFRVKNKMFKIALYYITIILLILDPIYLAFLHQFVGGGDMNGITKGLGVSSFTISITFGFIALINTYIIFKFIHPGYKNNFAQYAEKNI